MIPHICERLKAKMDKRAARISSTLYNLVIQPQFSKIQEKLKCIMYMLFCQKKRIIQITKFYITDKYKS